MQECQTVTASAIFLNAIIHDDEDRTQLIQTELELHKDSIASILSAYHWNERGAVHGIELIPGSIRVDHQGEGRFKVKYGINIHYGCSDVDIELNNTMTITIKTDLTNASAVLNGENIPDREPDVF
jgi:hypothetical protein